MSDPYDRFDEMTGLVQPRTEIWWLVLGTVITIALYVGGSVAFIVSAMFLLAPAMPEVAAFATGVGVGDTPVSVLLLLSTFGVLVLALILAVRLVHKRGPGTLFGISGRRGREFWYATGVSLAVTGVTMAVSLPFADLSPNLDPARWALFLIPALVLIAVQTGAEELVFRGYLQQQLGARFNSFLVWGVLPSALFGVAHFEIASAGASAPFVALAAGVFGLVAADLTARTGSIMAAWGMHFANNLVAILGVGVPGSITGLALYLTDMPIDDTGAILPFLILDMILTVFVWYLVRRALRV
ncbi:lysostaphin resistance A-like protein [Tropicimonas sp. S265A]|uniref:CPBP family intramembrane glutamic endopeptidase n=1 Tax=Tropicimonas sp. S265A TaxID=3415134 RepID=UPI003C7D3B20